MILVPRLWEQILDSGLSLLLSFFWDNSQLNTYKIELKIKIN